MANFYRKCFADQSKRELSSSPVWKAIPQKPSWSEKLEVPGRLDFSIKFCYCYLNSIESSIYLPIKILTNFFVLSEATFLHKIYKKIFKEKIPREFLRNSGELLLTKCTEVTLLFFKLFC
jgi:hypothetical protein